MDYLYLRSSSALNNSRSYKDAYDILQKINYYSLQWAYRETYILNKAICCYYLGYLEEGLFYSEQYLLRTSKENRHLAIDNRKFYGLTPSMTEEKRVEATKTAIANFTLYPSIKSNCNGKEYFIPFANEQWKVRGNLYRSQQGFIAIIECGCGDYSRYLHLSDIFEPLGMSYLWDVPITDDSVIYYDPAIIYPMNYFNKPYDQLPPNTLVLNTTKMTEVMLTPGTKYLLRDEYDSISSALRVKGVWEEEYRKILFDRVVPGSVVLDIGAHIGYWSITLALYDQSITIHAFEPSIPTFYQLCGNLFINNITSVKAHNIALGDTNALSPLYISQDNTGNSTVVRHGLGDKLKTVEYVQVTTLDSFHLRDVSLIKIDAESSERFILRGGMKTLEANDYPPLFIEIWNAEYDGVVSFLTEIGYTIKHIANCDYLATHQKRNDTKGK